MATNSISDGLIILTIVIMVLTIVGSLTVLIPDLILGTKHAGYVIGIKFKGLFASSPNQGDGNGTA